MTYIITEPCIDVKDRSCVEVCPVDCIHESDRMLVIDPEECIDCGACEPECPVEAIFPEDAVPDAMEPFIKINYAYPNGLDEVNTLVEAREIDQWFLKTTAYADQLLDDLKLLEGGWPERVITMQRNWIGKSTGAKVKFAVADVPGAEPIEVFTTRIDTIYGASAVILASTHPLLAKLLDGGFVHQILLVEMNSQSFLLRRNTSK